jgi:formylglycine-generating enzyme required for sulfatase activity
MTEITSLIAVLLDGAPPPELELPILSGCGASADLVATSFTPFANRGLRRLVVRMGSDFDGIGQGLGTVVVYLVGHGWIDIDGCFVTSLRSDSGSMLMSGGELIERLNQCLHPECELILLVDTCEAAALKPDLPRLRCKDMAVIFASERGEEAWHLVPDGTTRFALELSLALSDFSRAKTEVGIAELAATVRRAVERESVGFHQTITYRVVGDEIRICSLSREALARRRIKTFRRIRTGLMVAGGALVALLFLVALYWHSHVVVTVQLGNVAQIADSAIIAVYGADPDSDVLEPIKQLRINGGSSVRLMLPAANLLIAFNASYKDGRERAIRFHKIFKPGFTTTKTFHFVLPSVDEITQRPGMAYISADSWLKGDPTHQVLGAAPFWIDIAPPTIEEYFPFIVDLYAKGQIEENESVLVWELMHKADLSRGDFQRTKSPSALLNAAKGRSTLLQDPSCPAPMTEREARLYLKSLGKHLPSADEWELAVRGVDGRIYPWGNRRDDARINAGMPRNVGWEARQKLRPVREHPESVSPFGLIDTVGNAGDWVEDEGVETASDDVRGIGFKGGIFHFNVEDCTAHSFIRLPNTEAEMLAARGYWLITCRGVMLAR